MVLVLLPACAVASGPADSAPTTDEPTSSAHGAPSSPPAKSFAAAAAALRGAPSELVAIEVNDVPFARCHLRPTEPGDTGEGLLIDADDQGAVRFYAQPELLEDPTLRPELDCVGYDGSSSSRTVDLQASVTTQSIGGMAPGRTIRPALTDPMALSEDELLERGYPPRPDADKSPSDYTRWLSMVSTPTILVPGGKHLPLPGRTHAPSPTVTLSPIWSGGILAQANTVYEVAAGMWAVPDVSASSGSGIRGNLVSSVWVGIGGSTTSDLLQAGTEQDWQYPGFINNKSWYEQLGDPNNPSLPQPFGIPIAAGDTVYVLAYASDATGHASATGAYASFTFTNTTKNMATPNIITIHAPGSAPFTGSSAEWIVERPPYVSNGNITYNPLAKFGQVAALGWVNDSHGTAHTNLTDTNYDCYMFGQNGFIALGGFIQSGWPGASEIASYWGGYQ